MDVDLRLLQKMHPLLPAVIASDYTFEAAIALQRHHHEPGAVLVCRPEDEVGYSAAVLHWTKVDSAYAAQLDRRRTTEYGAEAVALALAATVRRWVVRRRLQQGEAADWLLRSADGGLIALEISGIDGPFEQNRLTQKLSQVAGRKVDAVGAACVVAFGPPAAVTAIE